MSVEWVWRCSLSCGKKPKKRSMFLKLTRCFTWKDWSGGAANVVPVEKFNLEKIDILIPHNLEIVWGMLRPKSVTTSGIKEIIVVSFYSPPKSPKKSQLLDHILTTIHVLLTKYPNAGIIIGADKNDLNISSLISGIPRTQQIVTKATHKDKILDILAIPL